MPKSLKDKTKVEERSTAVLLLRFRTEKPDMKSYKFMSYASIAKITGLTYNQVQHICVKALKTPSPTKVPCLRPNKLLQEHREFLINPKTLEVWAGSTIKERCQLFHRRFPNKRIAPTSLRRLYQQNKIKRKKVRQEKYLPGRLRANYA